MYYCSYLSGVVCPLTVVITSCSNPLVGNSLVGNSLAGSAEALVYHSVSSIVSIVLVSNMSDVYVINVPVFLSQRVMSVL